MRPDSTSKELLDEREKTYGNYADTSRISQCIKLAFRTETNWDELSDDAKESLDLLATKLSRILNGDPNHVDSWRDCIGYLQLILESLEK